jgi:hypothetical protein
MEASANWCYQLAWRHFDLCVAHKLNLMGNAHTAKARELSSEGGTRAAILWRKKRRRKLTSAHSSASPGQ